MTPELKAVEERRRRNGKERPVYSAHVLESLLVYQQVCGLRSCSETRDRRDQARTATALTFLITHVIAMEQREHWRRRAKRRRYTRGLTAAGPRLRDRTLRYRPLPVIGRRSAS